jgi:putative FmdB family regulatory protein
MPIYEYHCPNCGAKIEVNRPMVSRDEPLECACGDYFKRRWGIGGIVV